MQTIQAMTKLSAIAGPASAAAACPVMTKMPAPMTVPTPVRVRLVAPKLRVLSVMRPPPVSQILTKPLRKPSNIVPRGVTGC